MYFKKIILRLISFPQWIIIPKNFSTVKIFYPTLFHNQVLPLSQQSSLAANTRALILRQLSKDQTRKDAEG